MRRFEINFRNCSGFVSTAPRVVKPAFHDADTDIFAKILADTSDTRDFLKLFLWQAETTRRHSREDVDIVGDDVCVGVVECEL